MTQTQNMPDGVTFQATGDETEIYNLTDDNCTPLALIPFLEWETPEDHQARVRLFAGSYNSYRKHCGPRAIECAEEDLLGELLEALRQSTLAMERNIQHLPSKEFTAIRVQIRANREVIAKAEGRS